MVDACTITRITATSTDPDTGVQTPTTETVYEGACRVQQRSPGGARAAEAGEASLLMLRMEIQLPNSAVGIAVGDTATITASASDADLVDREFRVRELAHKSEATARRIGVEEVTG
jgi:uracil-DNA glycosylase